MRVQRAVAGVLLSFLVGCGQAAVRQGAVAHPEVAWGVRAPGDSLLQPLDLVEGLEKGVDGEDEAEAYLNGGTALWPVASHPKVVSHADRLRRSMAGTLRSGFARSGRYLDIIQRELEREGVPAELAFLPMVESSFSHQAVGRGAAGLWQFTPGTAQRYGLIVNREVDERRDPEKASRAAARLLRDLYDQFSSWELAVAAYNAGPGRVEAALARNPGASFWQLSDRALLPRITRDYVPKVLATALIAARPEEFGLAGVERYEPLRYDTYVVSQRLEVQTIASLCGSSPEQVVELNPALRKGVVPSTPAGFQIRLPEGTGERFAANYAVWRGGRSTIGSRRTPAS